MTEDKREDTQYVETKIVKNSDWFLQNLVNMANFNNIKVGITLNMGGFLVSGILIGGKEYFKIFGDNITSGMEPSDTTDSIKASYAAFGNIYDHESPSESPSFIHLIDTKFHTTNGTPVPNNQDTLWRGRLSEVGGFIFGSLNNE